MTDTVRCPICEFTVPLHLDDQPSLLAMLLKEPTKIDPRAAEVVEAALLEHLSGHSVTDWTRAFVAADRYIEALESELTEVRTLLVEATMTQTRPMPVQEVREVRDTYQDPPPRLRHPNGKPDPDATLIPMVPNGQRPEGVVGRKT